MIIFMIKKSIQIISIVTHFHAFFLSILKSQVLTSIDIFYKNVKCLYNNACKFVNTSLLQGQVLTQDVKI